MLIPLCLVDLTMWILTHTSNRLLDFQLSLIPAFLSSLLHTGLLVIDSICLLLKGPGL